MPIKISQKQKKMIIIFQIIMWILIYFSIYMIKTYENYHLLISILIFGIILGIYQRKIGLNRFNRPFDDKRYKRLSIIKDINLFMITLAINLSINLDIRLISIGVISSGLITYITYLILKNYY